MKYTASEDSPIINILAHIAPDSSKTTLRDWLKNGRVTVNNQVVKISSTLVKRGQEVVVGSPKPISNFGIPILFEDKHIVVIDKPSGMLSVATPFEKGNTAHGLLKEKYRPRKIFVVHRLDQDTSGVMLFALTEEAYRGMKELFEKHSIERCYTAVIEGHLETKKGTWESYLYEDANYVVHSTENPEDADWAVTHYEIESTTKKYSLLNLKLETGKKNQIRVHCQDAGHPVVGDRKYGSTQNPIKRVCLHAYLLAFEHPVTHKMMRFESPVPHSFLKVMKTV